MPHKWELPEANPSYRKPTPEMVSNIAYLCGVRPDWLQHGTGAMEIPDRVEAGRRITQAIQALGGWGTAKTKITVPEETLRRWMRVGPASAGEAVELERSLRAAGAPISTVNAIFDESDEPISLLGTMRADRAPIRTLRPKAPREDEPEEGWISIPIYTARAAAGASGYQNGDSDETDGDIRLSAEHIRQVLRVPPASLAIIHVHGDSMVPILQPGDAIFIDSRIHEADTDGIYLVRQDGAILVKQLQRLPGGTLQVTSRNRAYAPYTITADNHDGFSVLGRVVGKCGRL